MKIRNLDDARRLGGLGAKVVDRDGIEIPMSEAAPEAPKSAPVATPKPPPSLDLTPIARQIATAVSDAISRNGETQTRSIDALAKIIGEAIGKLQPAPIVMPAAKADVPMDLEIIPERGMGGYVDRYIVRSVRRLN